MTKIRYLKKKKVKVITVTVPKVAAVIICDTLKNALEMYGKGPGMWSADEVVGIQKAHRAYWMKLHGDWEGEDAEQNNGVG